MPVEKPTQAEVREAAEELGISLDGADLDFYHASVLANLEVYAEIDALDDDAGLAFRGGSREWVEPIDNPLGAWFVQTDIQTTSEGPLAGKTVVLKDNINLAGVPMMNGTNLLRGHVAIADATVVTRLLDAGARIVGKANCESLSFSAGSHTGDNGVVRNPHRLTHSSAGSSSGCGALVGAGQVDLAVGTDHGGSVRMPAAWCGAYGMKPTYGLVPFTGAMALEASVDHIGPMTASVTDNAVMLQVMAGRDGLDARQGAPEIKRYTEALGAPISSIRIGLLTEGFGRAGAEPDVDAAVRAAGHALAELGAEVGEVSVPWHHRAHRVATPVTLEGTLQQILLSNGLGVGALGYHDHALVGRLHHWQNRANELSDPLKLTAVSANLMRKRFGGRHLAKAYNLVPRVRAAYDEALEQFDLLMMPTVPMKAQPIPPQDAPLAHRIQRAFEATPNVQPFNISGHPAMSLPCAVRDGLPVGMMLVGSWYDESTIYSVAYAFEQSADWRTR
jgi:amidase